MAAKRRNKRPDEIRREQMATREGRGDPSQDNRDPSRQAGEKDEHSERQGGKRKR